jgi:hypothetical protein
MNKFMLFIIALYLILFPFYVFSSGATQPADVILAFGSVIFMLAKSSKSVLKKPVIKYLFIFVLLVSVINLTYCIYYFAIGVENKMFLPILFYAFNFMFFVVVLTLFKSSFFVEKKIYLIYNIIFVSLLIQFVLGVLGIQGDSSLIVSRPAIFFNNPNQLAYYSLLMISILTVLYLKFNFNKLIFILSLLFSIYLVIYSGSRAALSVFLLLIPIFSYKKINMKSILVFLSLILSIPTILNTNFVQEKIENIVIRSARNTINNNSEIQNRGYDRLLLYPEYLFYGAGENKNDRFEKTGDTYLEIHSGLANTLFSYGFLGLFLFSMFVFKAINKDLVKNSLLILPAILYNITHQGLRSSLLFGLIAIIYISSNYFEKKNHA